MPAGITAGEAIAGSAVLGAGSSLIGSGKSSKASSDSAAYSAAAQEQATALEGKMYAQTRSDLYPYNQVGQGALNGMWDIAAGQQPGQSYLDQANALQNQGVGYLNQAAGMNPSSVLSQANLEQTPGYQFTMQQGLKQTQAAAAARGLGVSGASLKGAAQYATGLADSTYSNRFNEAQQSYADVLNQASQAGSLSGGYLNQASTAQAMQQQGYGQWANLASLGENAAAQTGQAASNYASQYGTSSSTGAQQYGNYTTQAGQAQAAGISGVGSAATQGVNNYLSYSALSQALGNRGGTGGFVDSGSWD